MDTPLWKIPRDWVGQAAFVVAGGPSARAQVDKLAGRRVVAVNSSFAIVPGADVLFYADARWWNQFFRTTVGFTGSIVTISRRNRDKRAKRVEKTKPPLVKDDQASVTMSRTSLAGAIVLAAKRGAFPIVLIGADGQLDETGRRHNHAHKYPWKLNPESYTAMAAELRAMLPGLRSIGAVVLNASPRTKFDMFPSVDLDAFLADPEAEMKRAGVSTKRPAQLPRFERSQEVFDRFVAEKPSTVLDVGSGLGEYALAMRELGIAVTTCDLGHDADIRADFMLPETLAREYGQLGYGFDGVWVSHVLEHQVDVNAFLRKVRRVTNPNGLVAITVPPAKHHVVGGHVSLWNAGLLLYNMILAGFDCSEARVGTYDYNISVLVRRKDAELPQLAYDHGDIERLAPFFPLKVKHGFDGRIQNVGW